MNKEFEQWREQTFTLTVIGRDMINKVYNHLQANPHLLREDGEKETIGFIGPKHMAQAYSALKTEANVSRPTDMGQEAREMFFKHNELANIAIKGIRVVLFEDKAVAALTEFGKMWYERGREEGVTILNKKVTDALWLEQERQRLVEITSELYAELTTAKEQIATLEQKNADMELALKNL